MEYRQIVAVTGLGGLYQLMSTKNDGAIVRSLADKSVKFVSARIHHITPLESIEIYTTGDNVRLHEVLDKIKGKEEGLKELNLSKADNNAIRSYFRTVLPEFDEERVYVSDIKKVLKWYEILKTNDLLNFEAYYQAAAPSDTASVETEEVPADDKPAKKAAPKKKKAEEHVPAETAEKPVKKAAPKKKKDEATATAGTDEKPARKAAPKKKKEE